MMVSMVLAPWLAMMTAVSAQAGLPPGEAEVRADAAMQRAWRGRTAAVERICSERSRIARIQQLDGRFGRLQAAYATRFGRDWQGRGSVDDGRLGQVPLNGANGVLSGQRAINARCQSNTAFPGALGEYQNGITLAEVELGR